MENDTDPRAQVIYGSFHVFDLDNDTVEDYGSKAHLAAELSNIMVPPALVLKRTTGQEVQHGVE